MIENYIYSAFISLLIMHFQGLLVEVAQGIVVFPSLSLSDSLFANSNNVHPSGSVHSFSPIEEDRYMYIFYIQ